MIISLLQLPNHVRKIQNSALFHKIMLILDIHIRSMPTVSMLDLPESTTSYTHPLVFSHTLILDINIMSMRQVLTREPTHQALVHLMPHIHYFLNLASMQNFSLNFSQDTSYISPLPQLITGGISIASWRICVRTHTTQVAPFKTFKISFIVGQILKGHTEHIYCS